MTERNRVHMEEDVERAQTDSLARQMMKSITQQLETASEHVQYIRWLETDGSRSIDDPNKFAITEFELKLSSGKTIRLTGPIINMEVQG